MRARALCSTDPETGLSKTTESGERGLYVLPGLNPASYRLKVAAKGFQSFDQTGMVVNVSSTTRVDVKLTIGAETGTITVTTDALAVQTDSNVVSSVIMRSNQRYCHENRTFVGLATLALGEIAGRTTIMTAVSTNMGFSVNGLRPSHNIWLIDGGEADDRGGGGGSSIMPSQDAIAEFTILASNYPPDYGISSGATMSLSLKSGTQKLSRRSSSNSIATPPTTRTATSTSCLPRSHPRRRQLQHLRRQHRRTAVYSARLQHQQNAGRFSSGTKNGARS